jgi:5'-nucleotidase
MIYKYFIALIIGAGLIACSAVNTITVASEPVAITSQYDTPNAIDSMIAPFKMEMDAQMDSVIAIAEHDYTKGRPGGALNNWSADVIFSYYSSTSQGLKPQFCLLNVGGLRNHISQGDVPLGDIYKLMPFDNEIVAVEMPLSSIAEIETYLKKSGGEPISGAKIEAGKLKIQNMHSEATSYWIVTSDYLFNGGDNMDFFEQHLSVHHTGILMRDIMIDEAKGQGVLDWDNAIRITF